MATASDVSVSRQQPQEPVLQTTVSLAAIPFPAALIDATGAIRETNAEWLNIHPKALSGQSCFQWCNQIDESGENLGAAVRTGIQGVLSGQETRFVHEHGSEECRKRVTVSASNAGALILHHDCQVIEEPPEDGPKRQSLRMESVGRLVGGVTHDFANLLTLIAGYSDILLNRIGEKDPLRPELDEIRKAANRGAGLTRRLLGFTRGQAVDPQPVDLNVLVTDMQHMLRPIIGEHVEFETLLSRDLGRVMADAGQMEQVLMNLILNARDAMPNGGRIAIATANSDMGEATAHAHEVSPGPCVLLSIGDSGHGISSESMQHVFEPFFTTKEEGKGTGLGLSTVHSIIKQSGGDVWISSAPNEGACFTICLPRAQGPAGNSEPASSVSGGVGSETILLVEDEDGVRRLLTHILRKRGYQVLEASDGEEALRVFDQSGPDIHMVLTDMVMPKMGGRELGQRLRQIRPELKIIYMSGYTDDVLVGAGAFGPGMAFLQKPLRSEVLAAKVRETLDSPSRPFDPR